MKFKFEMWMRKVRNQNITVKKFLHYYDGHADMVFCRSGESIIKYLVANNVHPDLIKEFKIVWMYYEESDMMKLIQLQQKVKIRV